MLRATWPLVLLILIDIAGVSAFLNARPAESITRGLAGAYLSCGLLILQLPLCLLGLSTTKRAHRSGLRIAYLTHLVASILFTVFSNLDLTAMR